MNEPSIVETFGRLCKHICDKKKRQCKFSALRNSDYCVEHLAYNDQVNNVEKRVICPLDPKHSVYEKNFEKHLKKCNSRIKYLGDYDIKDINLKDDCNSNIELKEIIKINQSELKLISNDSKTYKQLNETELKSIIEFLIELDQKYNFYDLEYDKLEDDFINQELEKKNQFHQKHLKQISSIVSHVHKMIDENDQVLESCCLIELGAGRGKLSYWYDQSRKEKIKQNCLYKFKNVNIILIERGSQKHKFDSLIKQNANENSSEFVRIRIDLKDVFINQIPLVKKSTRCILFGKHVCGCATDFSIRCLKNSLEDSSGQAVKIFGFLLALCCHHVCEWDYFCGKKFLNQIGIESKLFYIIRSISSWSTSSDRNTTPAPEFIFGHPRQKIGRICKNLLDRARIEYIKNEIKIPSQYDIKTRLFYYIDQETTLENSMLYVYLKNK